MNPLPPRVTRAELAVSRLREGIASGEWLNNLPAERNLSRSLEVSRSTLRLALDQLKREGWIVVEGKRSRIARRPSRPASEPMRTRRIVFLSPFELDELPPQALFVYGELARRLAPLDATIQLATSGAFTHRRVNAYLDRLGSGLSADGWVLHRAPIEVQRYFQERALPAVLFGNAHKGIELPALQINYGAALDHCLAMLRRHRHASERIALLLPDTELAGNLELERSFRPPPATSHPPDHRPGVIIRHQEHGEHLKELLERALLRSRSPRPTAFVVLRTSVATTLHGLLACHFQLAVPQQVSLVCLEDSQFLKHLVPSISRYRVDASKIVRLIFLSLGRQLSSGLAQSWRHRPLIPEFIAGETVSQPPALSDEQAAALRA